MPLVNGSLTLTSYLDLTKKELRNAQIQNLSTAPSSPVLGQLYFDTDTNRLNTWNGSTWDEYGTGAGVGDVTGGSASTDGEVVLYNSTTGKIIKRSNGISGIAKLASGVLSAGTAGTDYSAGTNALATGIVKSTTTTGALTIAAAGTDYLAPAGDGSALTGITESQVTGLVTDLGLKAALAGPTFTGVPAAPTASGGTNTTQIATTAYVTTAVGAIIASSDAMVFKGVIDCSANPNYPAANAGDLYKISVAGKIGGASGTNVEVGDSILCTADGTSAGTQGAVGASWFVTQTNLEAASTSVAGFVSLATQAEAETGSVSTKALTPASMVGFPRTYSTLCGDGTGGLVYGTPGTGTGALLITHNLGLADRDAFTWDLKLRSSHTVEYCEVTSIDVNSVGLWGWTAAPASNAYYVTITG